MVLLLNGGALTADELAEQHAGNPKSPRVPPPLTPEEHGRGLDVAMHQAQRMRGAKTSAHLRNPTKRPLERHRLAGARAQIKEWEDQLNSVGEDAQLAQVDLQAALQKQEQTLQTMSNVSKMLHDTAMAVIRKIGG